MAPTPKSSPSPWPSTPARPFPCAIRSPKSAPSAPSSSSTPFIFNTAIAPSPISPTSPSPSSASRLLAAIVLVDETRWDGQERSTRYQNFLESGFYFPDFAGDAHCAELYARTIDSLFGAYKRTTVAVVDLLRRRVARPDGLKPEAYERTLRARAFDVARYLLPLATNTSLGQIVSARTLETQVSRLLSHPAAEIRLLGEKLREAATGPAWNLNAKAAQTIIDKTRRPR